MKLLIAIAAALLGLSAVPAAAQDETQIEEIVVTGSRVREWDVNEVPAVKVPHRADNLIVAVRVVNDTREATLRRTELVQTLRAMARAAEGRPDIALSIEDDGALVPLTEDMVSTLTLGVDGARADTSTASLVVKTPIRTDDTLDSASARIEQFVARAEPSGRSLVSLSGGWELSIINPAQYRASILAAIAEDARRTAATFGPGYAVEVTGLSNPVTWKQSGPLDLSMFIPFALTVTPQP